jgi:hypothetical protein
MPQLHYNYIPILSGDNMDLCNKNLANALSSNGSNLNTYYAYIRIVTLQ